MTEMVLSEHIFHGENLEDKHLSTFSMSSEYILLSVWVSLQTLKRFQAARDLTRFDCVFERFVLPSHQQDTNFLSSVSLRGMITTYVEKDVHHDHFLCLCFSLSFCLSSSGHYVER